MKYHSLILLAILVLAWAERKSYYGYEEWEVIIGSSSHLDILHNLEDAGEVDILKSPRAGHRGVILVAPDVRSKLHSTFSTSGIRIRVLDKHVHEKIQKQYESIDARHQEDQFAFDVDKYNTFDDLMSQIDVWLVNCPSGIECTKSSIGKSYEGKDQTMLKFKKTGSSNKALYFEFTIHAREWLSTTTGQKLIDKIVNDYPNDTDTKDLVDNYDIHILLVANPDGYVHTFVDRMWRKSRKPNTNETCIGTDLNRNFDNNWGEQGTSSNGCTQTFKGESVAELEVENMQNYMKEHLSNRSALATYAVHCCAKMWMFPYGYTEDFSIWKPCVRTDDHDDLSAAAEAGVDAVLADSGVLWEHGTICETIYPVTGSTTAYSYSETSIKYSWAIETDGWFTSDETEIEPTFRQFWKALVASTNKIEEIEGI